MEKTRNCSIDILRLLFSVLVVAIHTNPFAEYNAILSYFCSQTISRLAIPFFAGVTGYFFFKDNSERKYQKYLKRFFILYTFWSILMLLNDAVHWDTSLSSFVVYALKTYFLTGWRQLWYLLAVIYIILFLTFANKISKRSNMLVFYFSILLLACGIAADNYGRLFSNINALNWFRSFFQNSLTNWPMVLPFFMVGFALNNPYPENHKKRALPLAVICIFGLLLEILFTTLFDLHENVVLCLFTYPSIYFLLIWAINT